MFLGFEHLSDIPISSEFMEAFMGAVITVGGIVSGVIISYITIGLFRMVCSSGAGILLKRYFPW